MSLSNTGSGNGHKQEATVASPTSTIRVDSKLIRSSSPDLQAEGEKSATPTPVPPVVPPDHAARTLILCFDGTGDQFDADNSNIVQLVSLLKKDDSTKQLVYYQVRFILLRLTVYWTGRYWHS